jgi:hypothetical protein
MTRSTSRNHRLSAAALLALMMVIGLSRDLGAQTTPAAPVPTQSPAEAAPDKTDNPGLINELGKLFKKPSDLFPSLKASPDTPGSPTNASPPGDTVIVEPIPPVGANPTAAPPTAASPASPAPPPVAATPATPATPASPGMIPKMVTGRAVCPVAANGAPDCKAGADALCKSKGMTSGRSLDMDSAHNCSTQNILSGARSIKDICRTETFVTRAMCQ